MQTNIIIADDHSMVRKGIKLLLQANMGYNNIREATSCSELMSVLQKRPCSHLLLDIIFSGGTALEIIGNIRSLYPETKVMIFSMQLAEVYAEAFKQYDVHFFLNKSSNEEHTISLLKRFLNNEEPPLATRKRFHTKSFFISFSTRTGSNTLPPQRASNQGYIQDIKP